MLTWPFLSSVDVKTPAYPRSEKQQRLDLHLKVTNYITLVRLGMMYGVYLHAMLCKNYIFQFNGFDKLLKVKM